MPIIENPAIYVTIEITTRFGTKRLIIAPMWREDNHVLNCCYHNYHKTIDALADLSLGNMLDDEGCPYNPIEVEYHDVYSIDARRAELMAKTLKHINKIIDAEQTHDIGDRFFAFCRAIKAQGFARRLSLISDLRTCGWRFESLAQGRNELRNLVAKSA